ncbi:hypothetical protein LTR80_010482 [Exophiala xenobiotica]|nr:hypothetical protein LTR14_010718 [Exophiala xenobiotica]
MSPSPLPDDGNEQPSSEPSSSASFSALVKYLEKSFPQEGVVSIPQDITLPFRRAFLPNDSSPLRELQKALENGRPKNILRLAPPSFCWIVSIVLQYPYSLVQSKLLYLFVDVIRQHKKETAFAKILTQVQKASVTPENVRDRTDLICKKLAGCVLRHLVSEGKDTQLRWRAAQLLSVVLHDSSVARNSIAQLQDCCMLTPFLEAHESYVLRVLVADIVRGLLYNGMDRAVLKSSPGPLRIVDDIPISENAEAEWLGRVVDFLSDYDLGRAFAERVRRMEYGEGASNAIHDELVVIASVSNDITFLLPGAPDLLTLFSIPVTSDLSISSTTSESDSSSAVKIGYAENTGFWIKNGKKSATDTITITLDDDESADSLVQKVREEQNTAPGDDLATATTTEQALTRASQKRSLAFVDLDMFVDTEGDQPSFDQGKRTPASLADTSGVEISSPLENLSQRNLQKKASQAHQSEYTEVSVPSENKKRTNAHRDTPRNTGSSKDGARTTNGASKHPESKPGVRGADSAADQIAGKSERVKNKERTSQQKPASELPVHKSRPQKQGAASAGLTETNEQANVKKSRSRPSESNSVSSDGQPTPASLKTAQRVRGVSTQDKRNKVAKDTVHTPIMMDPQAETQADQSPPPAPAKPGLKKRSLKQSTAGGEPSQLRAEPESMTSEFDLPYADEESDHPKKKAKTKNSKQPVRTQGSTETKVKKITVKPDADSQKARSQKGKGKQKAAQSPVKQRQKTVALTRARRAVKSSTYVNDSDSDADGGVEDDDKVSKANKKLAKDDDDGRANDSYPVSKEEMEAARKSSELSFHSHLKKMVPTKEARENAGSSRQHPAGTKDTHNATPQRTIQPVSESPIPPVSENLLRRTSIVGFGPRGPKNQAVSLGSSAKRTTQSQLPADPITPVAVQKRPPPEQGSIENDTEAQTSGRRRSRKDIKTREQENQDETKEPAAISEVTEVSGPKPSVSDKRQRLAELNTNVAVLEKDDTSMYDVHDEPDLGIGIGDGDDVAMEEVAAPSKDDNSAIKRGVDNAHPKFNADAVPEVADNLAAHEVRPQSNLVGTARAISEESMHEANVDISAQVTVATHDDMALDEDQTRGTALLPALEVHNEAKALLNNTPDSDADESRKSSAASSEDVSEQECSDFIASDPASDDDMDNSADLHIPEPQQKTKSQDVQPRPETPLLEDEIPRERQKHQPVTIAQAHRKQSIGVAAILDAEYPQAEKTINTSKMRSILRPGQEQGIVHDARIWAARPDIEESEVRDGASGSNQKPVTVATTTSSRAQGCEPQPKNDPKAILEPLKSMCPPPPPRSAPSKPTPRHDHAPTSNTTIAPAAPRTPPRRSNSGIIPHKSPPAVQSPRNKAPYPSLNVPVRIKKTKPASRKVSISQVEAFPGTPMSFSTRLGAHASLADVSLDEQGVVSEPQATSHRPGDGSLTLVNEDESVLGHPARIWPRRVSRRRSVSTDGMSSAMSPSDGSRFAHRADQQILRDVQVRDTQHGLLNAITRIATDVLLRFSQEEDAVKTKVDEYFRGGDQIVQTLTDSWNERLNHEHRNIVTKLGEEKDYITKASKLVTEQNIDMWKSIICDNHVGGILEKRTKSLHARIEALRNKQ